VNELLALSCELLGIEPGVERFDPDARAYEAFRLGRDATDRTSLQEPLRATSLKDALAETTSRWSWDRGDRLGIREIGERIDRLHVYAARRSGAPTRVYREYQQHNEYARSLEHICTIDLNIIAGIDVVGVGVERDIFERDQQQRPEGARR
jgi:hypothetical protein